MNVEVLNTGWLATIQDTGRNALMSEGITRGGALDTTAYRVANLLVGNEKSCAVFEITPGGFALKFDGNAIFAIGGGELDATISGEHIPCWRPACASRGEILRFGHARRGARAYLAIGGGLDVGLVLDSRSAMPQTDADELPSRPLRVGDCVAVGQLTEANHRIEHSFKKDHGASRIARWFVNPRVLPAYTEVPTLRAMRGCEYMMFTDDSRRRLWADAFRVSADSNRMGYRLAEGKLELVEPNEMLSEAVVPGTIQVPPDGAPIILLADCQTHGGYPRIAHVAAVDLPVVAQLMPGAWVRFSEITLDEAQALYLERERELTVLGHNLALR